MNCTNKNLTSQLSPQSIQDFQQIYQDEFKTVISPEQAGLLAISLLKLILLIGGQSETDRYV